MPCAVDRGSSCLKPRMTTVPSCREDVRGLETVRLVWHLVCPSVTGCMGLSITHCHLPGPPQTSWSPWLVSSLPTSMPIAQWPVCLGVGARPRHGCGLSGGAGTCVQYSPQVTLSHQETLLLLLGSPPEGGTGRLSSQGPPAPRPLSPRIPSHRTVLCLLSSLGAPCHALGRAENPPASTSLLRKVAGAPEGGPLL